MKIKLKPLKEQVIVITGASSGIGLATAKMAHEAGARLVLCSRNIEELDRIVDDLNSGAETDVRAIAVQCDVADADQVEQVAEQALASFGRVDTWVNNAGVTIYGKLQDVPLEEKRRLFDVNFWGVVHGCRSAVRALGEEGGAIINIGSVLSERAVPIQGMYSATKHAVKAYTDALRMELEAEGFPISVTLVKPAAINTPYAEHGKNYMDHHPTHKAPVYAPEVVAKAILSCAVKPQRDVFIGGSSKIFSFLENFAPRVGDIIMEKQMMEAGQSDETLDHVPQQDALFNAPAKEGKAWGEYQGHVAKTSAFTAASLHPLRALLVAGGLGVLAAAGIGYLTSRKSEEGTIDDQTYLGNRDEDAPTYIVTSETYLTNHGLM